MSRLKYAQNSRTDDDLIAMTKRVHVAKVFTLKEFNKKIDQIEWEILRYNTKLIIIDSLASLVKREFAGNNATVLYERSKFLSRISAYLKRVAELLGVSIVLANHVVGCFSPDCETAPGEVSSTFIPALGSLW